MPAAPHTLDSAAVAALLNVCPETGLGSQDALERLARAGPNRLPQAPSRSPWRVLLAQFKSLLILILLGAAALAALVGSTKDALVILAVVVITAPSAAWQR
jgi:Ca2+-transporting ATPase